MSEAPGQWKQEQRLLWCRKLLRHTSWGDRGRGVRGRDKDVGRGRLPPTPTDPACLLALVLAGARGWAPAEEGQDLTGFFRVFGDASRGLGAVRMGPGFSAAPAGSLPSR